MYQQSSPKKMMQLLTAICDVIFPSTESERVIRSAADSSVSNIYSPGRYQGIIYLSSYSEKIIQSAITENKFHNNKQAAKLLGGILDFWINRQTDPLVFIPIPLSFERQRKRGHNQVTTILRATSSQPVVIGDYLIRDINTRPQSELSRADRLNNVGDIFRVNKKSLTLPNKANVVLIDDVVTTGATMKAARATLAPHIPAGARLITLAIAH